MFPGVMQLMDMTTTLGKGVLSDYSMIESVDGNTVVCKDGSVYSMISFRGSCLMLGNAELNDIINSLATKLSNAMDKKGHAIEFYFSRNPDASSSLISHLLKPQKTVASRLGINLDYIFDEQKNFMPRWISREDIYLVLWTRPSIFSADESKRIKSESEDRREKNIKDKNIWSFLLPQALDTQHYERASRLILTRHTAFVNSFLAGSGNIGLSFKVLDGHDAMRAVYNSLYPDKSEGNWKALLPGDIQVTQAKSPEDREKGKIVTKWIRDTATDELSSLMWPRLDEQLFTDEPEFVTNQICRVGTNYFAAIDMSTAPLEIQPFLYLLRTVLAQDGREFPWRMSVKLEGDGLSGTGTQGLMASILGITTPNGYNRNIKRSLTALRARQEAGEKVVRVRLSFATWSPVSEGLQKLENRVLALSKAIEGWGDAQVSNTSGDPIASIMGSVLGLNMGSTAPAGVAPLRDVLYMLPWSRDVSPWEIGSCFYRTEDGRPFMIELGSTLQDTFNHLCVGPPGKGKSFLLATTNMAACLAPRMTDGRGGHGLPYIRSIDIGHSQSGFCRTIQEVLPADQKHQVAYKTMKMHPNCAINMMDTPLGCRYPLPLDAGALKNAISIIAMNEDGTLPEHMPDLIGELISEIYKRFSDKEPRDSTPKPYSPIVNTDVDKALARYNVDLERCSTWWDVVDILAIEHQDYHMASVAQRYAVPQFKDIISFQSTSLERLYGKVMAGKTGIDIIKTLQLRMSSAVKEYAILAHPTAFDLRDARIAILDIKDICNGATGMLAAKQNGLMYMISRFVLSSEFYQRDDEMDFFNSDYYDYHSARITRLQSLVKLMEYDEFHRTKDVGFVRDQIVKDFREGRKYNIMNFLASQSINDFDDDMFTFSSGVWILGCDDDKERRTVVERLNLSSAARYKLYHSLNGPSPDGSGAPFLVVLKVRDGYPHEHFLKNTPGPLLTWAFSTTAEDTALRDMLYKRMPPNDVRMVLSKRFPRGSAKSEIEAETNRRAMITNNGDINHNPNESESVIESFAQEVYDMWLRMNALKE